jgi:hypothetical protein
MARQQAVRRPFSRDSVGRSGATPGTDISHVIQFEPKLAVTALAFHLIDEGLCERVAGDSINATAARLRRAAISPTIDQSNWREMTNPQRLEWLLRSTRTAARLIDDELSVLEPADA